MTISTTVYVTDTDIGLVPTIRSLEGVDIGVVPDASTAPNQNGYWFWISATDFEAVEEALAEDHTVESFTPVWSDGDRRTYRIRYSDESKLISSAIVERDGLMLESRSENEGWLVELQFPDHATLYDLYEHATANGITFDVLEINQQQSNHTHNGLELTESQSEALVAAYEHGYYDEPRDTSLEELGAVLGISPTAVSGRLRRASAQLVARSLGYDDGEQGRHKK